MSSVDDYTLSVEKAKCYRGIAKVKLEALNFDHPLTRKKHRKVSQKNVNRLGKIFSQGGCFRLQQENFVNAVIDDAALETSLSSIGLTEDTFLRLREGEPLPCLNINNVDCLSGLHRIEAAREFLDDNDQWWVVRFFSKGRNAT